ncbi:MAG TPA: tetrahydrofolate dehydrogenase/cyclohydrolase catalytic domain-containing protein, partial [Burkholderiales bacterium]
MAARILDGKSLAAQTRAAVKNEVAALAQRGIRPGLAVLLVGENPASRVYVRNKVRACDETGVRSELFELPPNVSEEALIDRILQLNDDDDVHGVLVQLPLPKHIDAAKVQEAVSPAKDVDAFHAANLGALLAGRPKLLPCTP